MQQVIVVGGGLGGLSAAHTVLEHGINVLVIDKNSFFGGNSTKATSGINGALTKSQRALKIDDSPEVFKEECMRGGEGNRFCNELGRRDYVTGIMGKNKGVAQGNCAGLFLCPNCNASSEITRHRKPSARPATSYRCGRATRRPPRLY